MNELDGEIYNRENILKECDFSKYDMKRYKYMQDAYHNLVEITKHKPDHRNVDTLLTLKRKMEKEKNLISKILDRIRQYPIPRCEVIHPLEHDGYVLRYKGIYVPFNSTYRKTLNHLYDKREKMRQREREIMVSTMLSIL